MRVLVRVADLEGRTLRELALMRNTIYARAGHPFRKKWLHDYFSAQPWYKPLAKDTHRTLEVDNPGSATDDRCNASERAAAARPEEDVTADP